MIQISEGAKAGIKEALALPMVYSYFTNGKYVVHPMGVHGSAALYGFNLKTTKAQKRSETWYRDNQGEYGFVIYNSDTDTFSEKIELRNAAIWEFSARTGAYYDCWPGETNIPKFQGKPVPNNSDGRGRKDNV